MVRKLEFQGNRALDEFTLASAIATTKSSAFATLPVLRLLGLGEKRSFDEIEFRRDVVRLILLYRQSGYMNAVIDTFVKRRHGDAEVTFRIHEGEPVRVTEFTIEGVEKIFNMPRLRRDLPLQVGDAFNRFLFLASADTILARLRNVGFPYAQVLRGFDSDAEALRAELTLTVLPGRQMRVGEVAIEGLVDIDTSTVRRMLSVKPGDLYVERNLFRSQRDLYGMDIFRSVTVVLADSTPPEDAAVSTARVLIRVVEGPRHRVRIGAGYGSLDCLRLQSAWSANDFLGGARILTVSGRLSKLGVGHPTDAGFKRNLCPELKNDIYSDTANYSVGVTLTQPAFLSPNHRGSIGLFAERRSETDVYSREAVGFNVATTFNARRTFPVTLGYGYQVGRTVATPAVYCSLQMRCTREDRESLSDRRPFAAVSIVGVRDRTNSPLDPTRGTVLTTSLLFASPAIGSDSLYEFSRGEIDYAEFHQISRYGVLAWQIRVGTTLAGTTVTGSGVSFVPPDQRFYAGGPNSVRGYRRNELGPRVYVTSDSAPTTGPDGQPVYADLRTAPTGGTTVFVFNAELRLPSPVFRSRMRLGVFVDVGQVWERGDDITSLRGLRVTPGVGLHFATPLGPVRLDLAYNGYGSESGPLFREESNGDLTPLGELPASPPPPGLRRRLVLQFAVGHVF